MSQLRWFFFSISFVIDASIKAIRFHKSIFTLYLCVVLWLVAFIYPSKAKVNRVRWKVWFRENTIKPKCTSHVVQSNSPLTHGKIFARFISSQSLSASRWALIFAYSLLCAKPVLAVGARSIFSFSSTRFEKIKLNIRLRVELVSLRIVSFSVDHLCSRTTHAK